jgi:hypothetical protein
VRAGYGRERRCGSRYEDRCEIGWQNAVAFAQLHASPVGRPLPHLLVATTHYHSLTQSIPVCGLALPSFAPSLANLGSHRLCHAGGCASGERPAPPPQSPKRPTSNRAAPWSRRCRACGSRARPRVNSNCCFVCIQSQAVCFECCSTHTHKCCSNVFGVYHRLLLLLSLRSIRMSDFTFGPSNRPVKSARQIVY